MIDRTEAGMMKKDKDMKKITNKNMMKQLMKDNPVITAPAIDKLSGVVDLKDVGMCGQAFSGILDWLQQGEVGVVKVSIAGKYALAVKIHYPVEEPLVHTGCPFLLLQITSPKASKRQIRFEYNPARMTKAGEEYLADMLNELLGVDTFYEFLYHARFTRVDWCRNILLRDVEDYLFRAKWAKVSQSFFGASGKMETLNLGKSDNMQIIVYDKSKQLHGEAAEQGMIRVEARCKINMTILELAKMKNPFERVVIYSLHCQHPPYGTAHWRGFVDSCRFRGVTNALKRQPADHRPKLKKVLSDQPVWWWDILPDDWNWLLPAALEDAGLWQVPNSAPPLTMAFHSGAAA